MNEHGVDKRRSSEKVEVSIHIDSELLEQVQHLTNDTSRVIETALRQWLRGEIQSERELSRNLLRNPPVPPRGEWND
ncbi:MAG: type II toxin-antitoxin system CcdA family antitoxin [Oscillatoriaceae bacterium SKW80]|nr:type II toxin-antitoxin system CcdA family antitoxin [Oscillatoriaceae bacterium SKYG93]MCX8119771.1 type II toxin-antitoxin system CcdA family antitoxin [Oscillatoriaceae bacterium SKW80]MDW8452352.1 type II toxin-antitoxin system CcdA family antitoxin [Oscillatoriaceae cyanobacterium SKYGB_i_bin93]HIK27675.1 type II toxin-antitoxin system CcdA family antitoxin [Oscillatoriaceae cyanobacterium M7585_C2015_266]